MTDPPVQDLLAFVDRALSDPLDPDEIRVIAVPAATDPVALLEYGDPAVFWASPDGAVHAGAGSAATLSASGDDRFAQLRNGADALWPRVRVRAYEGAEPVVRLFGGVSFLPGAHRGPWRAFGDATFFLPRLLRTDGPTGSTLSIAVAGADGGLDAPQRAALVQQIRRVLESGSRSGGGSDESETAAAAPPPPEPGPGESATAADAEAWIAAVQSIQRCIRDGKAEKIVAARSEAVPWPDADATSALRRLGREPAAFRFAFRIDGTTFLGATPERLVRRQGSEVRTEALAGTVAAGQEARLAPLLESVKEGAEHAVVVQAIVGALEPVCDALTYPAEPTVQRLRHVHHLRTPFRGRLRRPVHVLELVERLHPTPAVGGWPPETALQWIREQEPGDRGWYAAPIGWLDAAGDGEFAVALRSALLHHDRAYLYAGAGIVADSDAEAELKETEVKLRTIKEALGVS